MILITGAAGFIASAIAEAFNKRSYKTITIDNLSTGYKENVPKSTVFIKGDCGDQEVIQQLDDYDVEAIVHFSGQSSGEVSFYNPLADQKSNTTSTILLAKYAKERGIKKFIYASSMSVYGDSTVLPVDEIFTTTPKSFYAVGKLASEHYLRINSSDDFKTVALRLFNVYGPGQNLKNMNQGMLSIYLAQALRNNEIVVKGSLERFRDLVYIQDVVNAVMLFFDNELDVNYDVYNVSNSYPVKVIEMIDAIKSSTDKNMNVVEIEGTPGDQFGIYGSNEKLKALGWAPGTKHEEGIHNMIQWAKENI